VIADGSQVFVRATDERSRAGFLAPARQRLAGKNECTLNSDGSLRISVFEPVSGRVELLLTCVSPEGLDSIRSISNLIGELRTELKAGRRGFAAVG